MLEESQMRKNDFKKQFKKTMQKYYKLDSSPPLSQLVEETVMSNAPSYYIGYGYARRMLSLYRKGKLPTNYNKLRRLMIAEIARKIDRINRKKGTHSEGKALIKVLAEGKASRFFISPTSAMRLIYR